jgi:predicted nucleic acid-binding protein
MRIYLDTSVISHLIQPESPEKTQRTLDLWNYLKLGECETCISESVLAELTQCPEPKQTQLFGFLGEIPYLILETDRYVDELVEGYLSENVLTKTHYLDLYHLATASVNFCNILLSWNFRHIVQYKTMTGVNITNKKFGYGELLLLSPFSLTWEEE